MNKFEKESVMDIYNSISGHFNNTRHFIWPSVKQFLDTIPKYSIVADIGCGNGKNMTYLNNDHIFIGTDFSIELLKICNEKQLETVVANNCTLPYKDNSFDSAISIAVIHHLSTPELRQLAINEIIRITKPKGLIMIQVWAFERDYNTKYEIQDAMIPWKTKDNKIYNRYYYLFKENELNNMVKNSKYNVEIIQSYKERDNYIIILTKL
jgi:ubiquinone/menaquinone biosynthesis C-methylase UbiE